MDFYPKNFHPKDLYTFKYEVKCILSSRRKNTRVWNAQQNKLISEIMRDFELKNRRNEVARIFYSKSQHRHFRTGKKCREHWLNHLDSSKKHGKWDQQEDSQILKCVFSNGKKWSLIAKEHITHRTEHMIKNRYKSLMFKEKHNVGGNQEDQNKIQRRIIRRISQSKQKCGPEIQKDLVQNGTDLKLESKVEIAINQNVMENSELQKIDKHPLNNFNFQSSCHWVCFWPQSLQQVNFYQFSNGYSNGINGCYQMSKIQLSSEIGQSQNINGLKTNQKNQYSISSNLQPSIMQK